MKVGLVGDWKKARVLLAGMPAKVQNALEVGLRKEGRKAETLIKTNIQKGPPPPLAGTASGARGKGGKFVKTKALNVTGDLRGSVTVLDAGLLQIFIGIPRNAPKHGGKACNLAAIHEFGKTITIHMTKKMRKFLFGVLFKDKARTGPKHSGGGGGILVIRIPARPFIRPAFAELQPGFNARMTERVAKALGNLAR